MPLGLARMTSKPVFFGDFDATISTETLIPRLYTAGQCGYGDRVLNLGHRPNCNCCLFVAKTSCRFKLGQGRDS